MDYNELNVSAKLLEVKQYLSTRISRETKYQDLIQEIDDVSHQLALSKPRVKLVSQSESLVKNIQYINQIDPDLEQQYQFTVVAVDTEVALILRDCEFVFLIYLRQHQISPKDWRLIQQTISNKISLKIIVIDTLDTDAQVDQTVGVSNWIKIQRYPISLERLWSASSFLILNDLDSIEQYHNFLNELFALGEIKLQENFARQIFFFLEQNIEQYIQEKWRSIKQQKEKFCQTEAPEIFRQKIDKVINQARKKQDRTFQKIKQKVYQRKSELTNPFLADSLIWQTQKIIHNAEIEIIKHQQQQYLYPVVKSNENTEPLAVYLLNLYQHSLQKELLQQWDGINNFDVNQGLAGLREEVVKDIQCLAPLTEIEIQQFEKDYPHFNLDNLVYLPILEEGSKIQFEYSFNQSQWFRIIAAASVGFIIFTVTKIFAGEGRYFGFIMLIFQCINLFTGQDVKTLKLKQQSKDLKRKLDNKYQMLIRLSAEKITQTLIGAIDKEQQFYRQQTDAIACAAHQKISTVKEKINQERENIDLLKQDLKEICSLLQ